MSTEPNVFLDWLNKKMEDHGATKLIPPTQVFAEQTQEDAENAVRQYLTEQILTDVNFDAQVSKILSELQVDTVEVQRIITGSLHANSDQSWRKPVGSYAKQLSSQLMQGWNWKAFDS